jgi:hypothetical protein
MRQGKAVVSGCVKFGQTSVGLKPGFSHAPPSLFLFRAVGFAGEHSFFSSAASLPLLAPYLLDTSAFGGDLPGLFTFDLIQQQPASNEPVKTLLTCLLAFYLQACGPVDDLHTGGEFVDVLAAVPPGFDKRLFKIRFANTQCGHALGQLLFLFQTHSECAHGSNLQKGFTGGKTYLSGDLARSQVIPGNQKSNGPRTLKLFAGTGQG